MTQQKLIKTSLFFLIILGILARLWQFGQIPISLYWDEVAIGLDAQSIAQTGKDINNQSWLQTIFYSYGDYKAPVYIWITSLLAKIFPLTQAIIRLPSLLAGLLTGFLLYLITRRLFPKKPLISLLTLTTYLIIPWSIHFSRIAMESHLSLLFLTLSIFLTILSCQTKKPWLLLLSGLSVSLGIYTYISLRIIAPLMFLISFIIFHPKKSKKSLTYFILGLFLITVSILTLTKSSTYQASQFYRLSNNNLITSTDHINKSVVAQTNPNLLISRIFHHRYLYKLEKYTTNYLSHFSAQFLLFTGDKNLRHHSGFGGQLLLIQEIFLIIGVFVLLSGKNKKIKYLIFSWILLSPTISALVNEVPHASRSIYMIIPLAWLIGLGLNSLNKKILVLSLLALLINFSLFSHYYFKHYPKISAVDWINPYKQAALFIKNNPTDKDIYVTHEFYQPGLYFQFYANQDIKELNSTCPDQALCICTPECQSESTEIVSSIPGTDKLVIKQTL